MERSKNYIKMENIKYMSDQLYLVPLWGNGTVN